MWDRERLHALIDTLQDAELPVALGFLESLGNEAAEPRCSLSDAPLDDESLTAEDEAALVEAERDLNEGRVVTHEVARRHLRKA